jgi:hypothetical protein
LHSYQNSCRNFFPFNRFRNRWLEDPDIGYFIFMGSTHELLHPHIHCLIITMFTRVFFVSQFFKRFGGFFPRIPRPSILHLGMVTHSYCRSWQPVTSFVLQECGISAVLVRALVLYYKAETFHFKFMSRIPNSGPNLKVTSKTMPSKNSSHNFRAPVFDEKIGQESAKITRVNTVFFVILLSI